MLRAVTMLVLLLGAVALAIAATRDDAGPTVASPDPSTTSTTTAVTTATTEPRRCPYDDGLERIDDPGRPAVGLATNFVWDEEADVGDEMEVLASCGVTAIREDLLWEHIEPERGRFAWDRTDRVMRAAAAHGVGVLGILGYSAPWASSDPSGDGQRNHPPTDVDAFAAYASAVAERYGPSSSFWAPDDSFRPLIGLEIWNEAWAWWAWRPDPDPAAYARLAVATAEAIEHVAPDVLTVLTADPFQNSQDRGHPPWFEAVLDVAPELPELVDAYAVHPYPGPRDVGPLLPRPDPWQEFGRVAVVERIARERGVSRPVWITEVGWSTSTAPQSVSEGDQASYVVGAVERAADEWPFVERFFVYTWARDREDRSDIESGFGLRRGDGTPKPALLGLLRLVADLARGS